MDRSDVDFFKIFSRLLLKSSLCPSCEIQECGNSAATRAFLSIYTGYSDPGSSERRGAGVHPVHGRMFSNLACTH